LGKRRISGERKKQQRQEEGGEAGNFTRLEKSNLIPVKTKEHEKKPQTAAEKCLSRGGTAIGLRGRSSLFGGKAGGGRRASGRDLKKTCAASWGEKQTRTNLRLFFSMEGRKGNKVASEKEDPLFQEKKGSRIWKEKGGGKRVISFSANSAASATREKSQNRHKRRGSGHIQKRKKSLKRIEKRRR